MANNIEEWQVQYENAVKSLQQVGKQVNDRIQGIRGGQDRRMFAQMAQNLRKDHSDLQRSLNTLARFDLQQKDVQLYTSQLDQFKQQLDELERRAKMTESEIMGEARFELLYFY